MCCLIACQAGGAKAAALSEDGGVILGAEQEREQVAYVDGSDPGEPWIGKLLLLLKEADVAEQIPQRLGLRRDPPPQSIVEAGHQRYQLGPRKPQMAKPHCAPLKATRPIRSPPP